MNNQQPVIFSYSFEEQGAILALEDNQIATELENSNLSWVHLDGNATSTKYWLEVNVPYLDHLIIDALLAKETRSRVMEFEGAPDVTDVADTSSDQVSTSTAAIDAPNNNEKTND